MTTWPDRLRAAAPRGRIDAFLDFFGGGYVELAVTELGISQIALDTIIDFPALERFSVKFVGNADASDAGVLAELADLIARGELEVPIAEVFALDDVQRAYTTLEERHTGARSCCARRPLAGLGVRHGPNSTVNVPKCRDRSFVCIKETDFVANFKTWQQPGRKRRSRSVRRDRFVMSAELELAVEAEACRTARPGCIQLDRSAHPSPRRHGQRQHRRFPRACGQGQARTLSPQDGAPVLSGTPEPITGLDGKTYQRKRQQKRQQMPSLRSRLMPTPSSQPRR